MDRNTLENLTFLAFKEHRVWQSREFFYKCMEKGEGEDITECFKKHLRKISSESVEEVMRISQLVSTIEGREQYVQGLFDAPNQIQNEDDGELLTKYKKLN